MFVGLLLILTVVEFGAPLAARRNTVLFITVRSSRRTLCAASRKHVIRSRFELVLVHYPFGLPYPTVSVKHRGFSFPHCRHCVVIHRYDFRTLFRLWLERRAGHDSILFHVKAHLHLQFTIIFCVLAHPRRKLSQCL